MHLFKKITLGLALIVGAQASAGVIYLSSLLNGKTDEVSVRKAILEVQMKYGKLVLYFGADWCKYCKKTKAAIYELLSQYPDVMFIVVDLEKYPYLKHGTMPKVHLYKNSGNLQITDSLSAARLKALLNQYYR